MNLDHNKGYEDFFYDALGSMTTNTLDKKTYVGSDGKTYYNLFSYIQLLPNISSTRTTKIVNKELAYSFGITGITPISIGTQAENTIISASKVYIPIHRPPKLDSNEEQ